MHSRELGGAGEKGEEEGNDVQISDFMHSREMGGRSRERRGVTMSRWGRR